MKANIIAPGAVTGHGVADRTVFQTREWLHFVSQTQRRQDRLLRIGRRRGTRWLLHRTGILSLGPDSGEFVSGAWKLRCFVLLLCLRTKAYRHPFRRRLNSASSKITFPYNSFLAIHLRSCVRENNIR